MLGKGNPLLAIMLGPSSDRDDDGDYGVHEAFGDAASAAMKAVQDDDADAFASALKDAILICVEGHNEGDDEEY